MACISRNIIRNSDFRQSLSPWRGNQIKLVKNPLIKNDTALLMDGRAKEAMVYQTNRFNIQTSCAYYLYFRVFNITPKQREAHLQAIVTYQNAQGKLLRITPLLIDIPEERDGKFNHYYTIVPPPPVNTKRVGVIFVLKSGLILLDTIRLIARPVGY